MTPVQAIDITVDELLRLPTAEVVAVLHLRDQYLNSIVIGEGKSAYDIAVLAGYTGTVQEWLASLEGDSSYAIAVTGGYTGTSEEWIQSLRGKNAYELAVLNGFVGTVEEWLQSLRGSDGKDAEIDYDELFRQFREDPEAFIDAISNDTALIIGIEGIIHFKRENVIGFTTANNYGGVLFTDSQNKSIRFSVEEKAKFTMRFKRNRKTLRIT